MKSLVANSKAGFNYETIETYQAGIVLHGHEVKSLRNGNASLGESFVVLEDGDLWLAKAYIAPYQQKNIGPSYDPYRKRKLLMTRKELREIIMRKQEAGLTVIPLSLYTKNRLIKVQIALVRGKKKYDKRETIKTRDASREIQRAMKR